MGCVGEVVPGLWIGSLVALKQIPFWTKINAENSQIPFCMTVVTVLSSDRLIGLATGLLKEMEENREEKANNCHITHVVWRLRDQVKANLLSNELCSILQTIDDAVLSKDEKNNTACLVHCAQGVSRSAAVCAAWLMSRRGHSLEKAMETIRKAKANANPNLGFLAELKAIEVCEGDIHLAMRRLKKNAVKEDVAWKLSI